jgi:hypothetical protein
LYLYRLYRFNLDFKPASIGCRRRFRGNQSLGFYNVTLPGLLGSRFQHCSKEAGNCRIMSLRIRLLLVFALGELVVLVFFGYITYDTAKLTNLNNEVELRCNWLH